MAQKTITPWLALMTNQARIADQARQDAHLAALESFGAKMAAQTNDEPQPTQTELAKCEAAIRDIEGQMNALAQRRTAHGERLAEIQAKLKAGGDPGELASLAVEGVQIRRILNAPDQSTQLSQALRREQEQHQHIKLSARDLVGTINASGRCVAALDAQIHEAQARLDLLTAQRTTLADGLAEIRRRRASLIGE